MVPRVGLEVVDVRDVADAHVRAMSVEGAAGERFLATGDLLWMPDIAALLRSELGDAATKVPTEVVDDQTLRELAETVPELRGVLPGLGRRNVHSTEKAERVLGWRRRPGIEAVLDCARSLLAHGVG
jgi:nucleoside-diphosphate-sugar epimerase